jgi:hypothetical protein
MFNAQKTVPNVSDTNQAAVRLSDEPGTLPGYVSFTVNTGPTVYAWWKLDESADPPTIAHVLANGYPIGGSKTEPISIQDPANPGDPSKLYLAVEYSMMGSDADFRAFS